MHHETHHHESVVYHTKDPIANLKIRVTFHKVTSALRDTKETNENDEYIFSWQEKIFSPTEKRVYSIKENCTTPLTESYHQMITQIKSKDGSNFPTKRIFSYVENDHYSGQHLSTDTGDEKPAPMPFTGREMIAMQQLTFEGNRKVMDTGRLPLPKTNVVIDDPSQEMKQEQHLMPLPIQTMYIMADLGEFTASETVPPPSDPQNESTAPSTPDKTISEEVVLFVIELNSQSMITVKPDFTHSGSNKGYRVVSNCSRTSYEYTVENVSSKMSKQDREREKKASDEIQSRHKEQKMAIIGSDFELSADNTYRVLFFGEILFAQNFESDNIYIHYFLELPQDWSTLSLDQLSGTTHLSTGQVEGKNVLYNFSFPLEFELVYTRNLLQQQNGIPKWPIIYFEVCSIDYWTRYRVEGYSFQYLPTTPGKHRFVSKCWRPIGNTVVADLRRFFVGGVPELEDTTFTAVPTAFEGRFLGKYGFRTESSGTITIQLHAIHQSREFIDRITGKKTNRSMLDRIGATNSYASVMDAIKAFRVAKANLIHVRQAFEGTLQKSVKTDREIDE